MLDGLLLLPLYFLDVYVGKYEFSQELIFVYFLLTYQVNWLYITLLHGLWGRTLGKMAVGIRVVRYSDGGPIGWRKAFIRELPMIILVLVCSLVWIVGNVAYFAGASDEQLWQRINWIFDGVFYVNLAWLVLELFTMLIHPEKRAIHDLIAGTIVVNYTPKSN